MTAELVVEHRVDRYTCLQGAYFTIDYDRLRIFKTLTGEEVTNKLTHGQEIDKAIFSSDNTKILLQTGSSSTLADVESGNIIGEPINHEHCFFLANGKHITAENKNGISIFYGGQEFWSFAPSEPCSFAANGHLIVISGHSTSIFDASTGKLTAGPITTGYGISNAALSLDGTRLVIWTYQKLEVLDIPSGDVIATIARIDEGSFIRLSPDGNRVIEDKRYSITIYDAASSSASCVDHINRTFSDCPSTSYFTF